jgi:Ca2+/H+ antiporter
MRCCHGDLTPCTFDTYGSNAMNCCQICPSNLFCRCIHHQVRKAACVRAHATQALHLARRQKQKCSATSTQRDLDVSHADSTASVAMFLRTTELLSLVSSVGLQAYALFLKYSQEVQEAASYECEAHQSEPVCQPQHHMISHPNWLSQFAVCALILAYVLGTIRRWVSNGR